jgi:hypothetical protein
VRGCERHDQQIRELRCADATDVRDTRTAVEQHVIILGDPLGPQGLKLRRQALAEEVLPVELLETVEVIVILAASTDQIQPRALGPRSRHRLT